MIEEPFDPRIDDAILAEPDALEPRRVLADFLEERGHPRAELLRLALAKPWHPKPEPFASNLSSAERALLVRYPDELLGTTELRIEWWVGFIDTVRITRDWSLDLGKLWPIVAQHRSYRFLRKLDVIRGDFRFDAKLPPPDSLREIETDASPGLLESLAAIRLPRVKRFAIDRRVVDKNLDPALLVPVLDALPAVDELVLECFDSAGVLDFATSIVPYLPKLRRLELDVFTDEAARVLIAAGLPATLTLFTKNETLSTTTRKALAPFDWVNQLRSSPGGSGAREPSRAPADFASRPRVRLVSDDGWSKEWVGSGVPLSEHPIGGSNSACGNCGGTNTVVIWARWEHIFTHGGWSERDVNSYELQCRECGRFSLHET